MPLRVESARRARPPSLRPLPMRFSPSPASAYGACRFARRTWRSPRIFQTCLPGGTPLTTGFSQTADKGSGRNLLATATPVLVAEDNHIMQSVLRAMLTWWGFDPVIAPDGDQAWRILQSAD